MRKVIFLYWYTLKRRDQKDNYGDLLSKYLVKKISRGFIFKVGYPSSRVYNLFKNYLAIGSIITAAGKNSIVWGSGIIKRNERIREATFLAVRGPLTRKRILELGYKCPEIYGDPAILLPYFFKQKVKKRYEIGVIPHYVDYQEVSNRFKNESGIKVINLITDNIESTTKEILECERIISSSLHGVIVSHTYKIPCLWVKFSEKLSGDDVKFHDYLSSMNIFYKNIHVLNISVLTKKDIVTVLNSNESLLLPEEFILEQRQRELLSVCPFNRKRFLRK